MPSLTLSFLRKRFENEKLGTHGVIPSFILLANLLSAPDAVEMEDLNYYYANYSRYVDRSWGRYISTT